MPSKNKQNRTLRRQMARLRHLLRSSRGKDILIFLLFLGVSYVFWLILALNDDMQQDVAVKLEITDIPQNYTFITEPPEHLQVALRDKGTVLTNYSLSGSRTLKIQYGDLSFDESKDRLTLTSQQLGSRLRALFDPTTQIISIRPDSLSLIVTDRAPSAAIVVPDIEVAAAPQYVISGNITVSPDTVSVYSARHLRLRPKTVRTVKISRTELKDTLHLEVRLHPEPGTRIVPSKVTLTVPVEPLIAKTREVNIHLTGVPANDAVVLFPSKVKVSYLLPMSLYNSENNVITVSGDFSHRHNGKIPLTIGALPDYYRGVDLSVDSTEYLVEPRSNLPAHSVDQ